MDDMDLDEAEASEKKSKKSKKKRTAEDAETGQYTTSCSSDMTPSAPREMLCLVGADCIYGHSCCKIHR